MSGTIIYVRVVKRTIEILEVFHSHDRAAYAEKDKVWQGDIQLSNPVDLITEPFRPATSLEAGAISYARNKVHITNPWPQPTRTYEMDR